MKQLALLMLAFFASNLVIAGTAENIQACVLKASEFAGVKLNEFEANYQGNVLSMSTAKWSNAFCEVKLGQVYNLQVQGKQLIYNQFAGKDSYDLNKTLEGKTEASINQLRARISLLEQRMNQASQSLKLPKPNHASIVKFVDEGIANSIGSKPQAIAPSGISLNNNASKDNAPDVTLAHGGSNVQVVHVVAPQEVLIPRSIAGDKGKYYLIESNRSGDVVRALHKRVGPDSVGYTKTETNCKSMVMREIGYSESSPLIIKENPTKWFELVPGSSKSDLAIFLCKREFG